MKKPLIASAILLAAAANAYAADLATPPPAPMYTKAPPQPALYNWTGFYIGGNAGWAGGSFAPMTTTVFSPTGYLLATNVPAVDAVGAQTIKPSGFTGGFEMGYNWQASNFVLGLEGDIQSFHLSGASSSGPVHYPNVALGVCPASCFTVNSAANTDWLVTTRGRVGFANNNWLFYATGGAAFTQLNGSFSFSDVVPTLETGSISSTRLGYAAGGGLEVGLGAHWSVKAEYLHVGFGTVSVNSTNLVSGGTAFPAQMFTHSIDLKADIARAGLNYHF